MIDPWTTPPTTLISESPIDESPRSKFTTVSPETREAAKIVAISMLLPPFPIKEQAIVDIIPNIMSSKCAEPGVGLVLGILEVRTKVAKGDKSYGWT